MQRTPAYILREVTEGEKVTFDKAQLGGGYNRNSVRLILGEVHRQYGQQAVDSLIREFDLTAIFNIEPGSNFSSFGR